MFIYKLYRMLGWFSSSSMRRKIAPPLDSIVFLGAWLAIPLGPSPKWQVVEYRGISANRVTQEGEKLAISVNSSAGAAVYMLPELLAVRGLSVSGSLTGGPALSSHASEQGAKHYDDFALRIGVISAGTKRMGYFQKLLLPSWVTKLARAAEHFDVGFGGLDLFLISSDASVGWRTRVHPQSEFIRESILEAAPKSGEFHVESKNLSTQGKSLGIWIGADGDDTKSSYKLTIQGLKLWTESPSGASSSP